ncbi:ATP-binding cassette domain-containing protein [Flavobacteriales bacterium]|nr:ATP-binding cassette domain-containing protein [Flavobacteriales bacterium]
MELLIAENIHKSYYNHIALNDVSISIKENSIFGLLGPNGAGKTSFIRLITQITAPDSGKIFFKGERLGQQHISKIGYLPEERGLYKKMKVGEQCIYLAQLKGMTEKEAKKSLKEWFEKFEIQSWWNKKVQDLSKGMQQKIQFVSTVMHEPQLLILDEPFSGFDPINTELIKKEIQELHTKGTTIIFSTHNMESVEEICTEIALINKSEKILGGNINNIKKEHKKGVYEISFNGNWINFSNALWTGFEMLSQEERNGQLVATVKANKELKSGDLLAAINPAVNITQFREVIPTMNEIFIDNVVNANSHE